MAKAIFIAKPNPDYDDLPEVRYHFPKRYIKLAEQTVGDWIIYYEPRRNGGRQMYFATARVTAITADPKRADHYYALIEDYLEFPYPLNSGDTILNSDESTPASTTSSMTLPILCVSV